MRLRWFEGLEFFVQGSVRRNVKSFETVIVCSHGIVTETYNSSVSQCILVDYSSCSAIGHHR